MSDPKQQPSWADNPEQIKTSVRWLVTTFGAGLAGFLAGKGWATTQQVMDALNSPALLSFVVTIVPLIWGLVARSKNNIVAAANDLPEVAGVIMKSTPEGVKIAEAVPSVTVVPAGTVQAQDLAKDGVK